MRFVGPKRNQVPTELETSAQRRGRMALAQLTCLLLEAAGVAAGEHDDDEH